MKDLIKDWHWIEVIFYGIGMIGVLTMMLLCLTVPIYRFIMDYIQ